MHALVERGYDAVADRYAQLEADTAAWPRMAWLERLLATLRGPGRVLDVGCGNGLPATQRIAERHAATGIDVSAAQIERARRNVPGADLRHVGVLEAEFDEPFDAIAAFYVIEHVARERHAEVLARFHDWLRPGGHLLFTIEPDDEPGIVGDWLGAPMFFSQYDAETTLALVAAAGFEVVERGVEDQLEGGRPVSYLWVLARRA